MVSEPNEKVRSLMRRLRLATDSKKLEWITEGDGYTFSFSRPNSSVVLSTRDEDGLAPFAIEVFNEDGRLIEKFRTPTGRVDENAREAGEELAELYESVRRLAFRVDDVLDDLMVNLPEEESDNPWI